jgi:hypothetical protein
LKVSSGLGGALKSNVSELLEVMERIYIDASMKCSADVYDLRDLMTIRSRVEQEGISFLTITLPQFSKCFERSLEIGSIDPAFFQPGGFHRVKNGAIPAFLQGMLGHLFNYKTGKVISYEPPRTFEGSNGLAAGDISTIVESIRQICRSFSKVEIDCDPRRVKAALDSFYEIEQELQTFQVSDENLAKFLAVSRLLWDNMVRDFVPSHIIPRHGPGATADRISGNQKYVWRRWHDRLESYFPLVDNGYPLGIPLEAEEFEIVTIIPEEEEQPVRVITVPKTLKSPRVIAIEPVCMQYVQQGIRDYLYDRIESYWLTAKRINFRDQSINQRLAYKSSKDGQLATIDLSEASDRVPLSLAMRMFDANLDLRDSILACRSTKAHLPDDRIINPLLKFASMGSALCFPVEAMYFYTICVMALLDSRNLSYTQRNAFNVTRSVYVYGDDIIVPSTNAEVVLDYLQKYNCKVNFTKTFYRGNFRESCGVDAFAGYEVTPTYIRKLCPENKQQSANLISWCATANLFYLKGYWHTASYMRKRIEKLIGHLPYVGENVSALGRYSFLGYESVERWNSLLQRFEVKCWIPEPVRRSDELEGWSALMKCLINMELRDAQDNLEYHRFHNDKYNVEGTDGGTIRRMISLSMADQGVVSFARSSLKEPLASDVHHLERSALHGAVTLKRRWAPAH